MISNANLEVIKGKNYWHAKCAAFQMVMNTDGVVTYFNGNEKEEHFDNIFRNMKEAINDERRKVGEKPLLCGPTYRVPRDNTVQVEIEVKVESDLAEVDFNVPGRYHVDVKADLPPDEQCVAAVKAFHDTVPISYPEDFDIAIRLPNGRTFPHPLAQNEDYLDGFAGNVRKLCTYEQALGISGRRMKM